MLMVIMINGMNNIFIFMIVGSVSSCAIPRDRCINADNGGYLNAVERVRLPKDHHKLKKAIKEFNQQKLVKYMKELGYADIRIDGVSK